MKTVEGSGRTQRKKTTKKVNWGQVRRVMTKLQRKRQRQRDRDRETDRDRQTDRQIDRDRETDRHRDTDRQRERQRETETKTGKERIMIPFYTRIKI